MVTTTKKLGWHFLPKDMKLEYGDDRKVVVGQTLSIPTHERPQLCHSGMHASEKISDACNHERGPVLTRVEVSGDISEGTNKFCGRSRKVLWAKEITLKDVNEIGKALGDTDMENAQRGNPTHMLSRASGNHDNFDAVMKNWAVKNGCPGLKARPLPPAKPRITGKLILSRLLPRTVKTKHEILRELGAGKYNMKARDSYFDDAFEEALEDVEHRVHTVANFTRSGAAGYLLVSRK